jgi:DNA polymerase-3 subunit epsilon
MEGKGVLRKTNLLVNPECDIPAESSKVHGIFIDDVIFQPTFKERASEILDLIGQSDSIAGFNIIQFDIPILCLEFQRAGMEWNPMGIKTIDAMRVFHKESPRDLTAAVQQYCHRAHDGAHDALADVIAAAEVFEAQKIAHSIETESDYAKYLPDGGGDPFGKTFRNEEGELSWKFGKHFGRPVSCDMGYIDWFNRLQDIPDWLKSHVQDAASDQRSRGVF